MYLDVHNLISLDVDLNAFRRRWFSDAAHLQAGQKAIIVSVADAVVRHI